MTPPNARFGPTLISLWLRLITIALIGLVFALMPSLPQMVTGWRFYQTFGEVAFGIAIRILFLALSGVALATAVTLVSAPFLRSEASRQRRASIVTKIAVGVAAYAGLAILAGMVFPPLVHRIGFRSFPVLIVYSAAFLAAMLIPSRRRPIVTSLDGFLGEKTTRRTALAIGLATAGTAAAEFAAAKIVPARAASPSRRPAGPNLLMVTFDACAADDMSLYGYRFPTTPRLAEFAQNSTLFTNFYAASTFTTPSVATMLTGLYPSEHHVYQLEARLRGENVDRTVPHVLREAGYSTAVATSSPYVYCLLNGIARDLDFFPDPAYRRAGFDLWRAGRTLQQRQTFGNPAREFIDLEILRDYASVHFAPYSSYFAQKESGYSPAANFAQARRLLDRMPEGFFLWVHVYAPHGPYMPDAPWLGRFQPAGRPMAPQDREPFYIPSKYVPAYAPFVAKARLRYDEFMAQADSAFGSFMADLETSGRLRNTAVVVAADHGESFEGGLFAHASKFQTRPELHIPLMIRTPGQSQGARVETAIDGTALAPTLLELAGQARPAWMRGPSALNPPAATQGLAFTQYLATNNVFRPVTNGTVGVIDGRHQFVLDLATGKGILRGLEEAGQTELDRSAENPALAQTMRSAIYARFPDLPRKQPA